MKDMKIDFSLYDEYKNITEKISQLKIWFNLNEYGMSNEEIHNKVFESVDELKKEFTEKENELLIELTNYLNGKEYDKSIDKKFDNNEKSKVFNYIYWRYRNENEPVSLNITKTRDVIKLKGGSEYKRPFKLKGTCNACKKTTNIYIRDYNSKDIKVKCENCNHNNINRYREIVFPIECSCGECKRIENEFFEVFKSNMNSLLRKIVDDIYDKFKDYTPSDLELDEDMCEDYKVNRAYLDKDVREILSLNPNNIEDIDRIINKIAYRKKYFNKNDNYNEIIYEKLLEKKIIYEVNKLSKGSLIVKLIQGRLIGGYDCYSKDYNIDDVYKLIVEDTDIDVFRKKIEISSYKDKILNRGNSILIPFNNKYEKDVNVGLAFMNEVIINKYFIGHKEYIDKDTNKENVKRIFQSDAENSLYIDLKNKYPNNNIWPNYKVRDVIDLDNLKNNLTSEEYIYLNNNASFNFVISDKNGYPQKVIQACIGKHHNEEEWIKKDKIKEKVCKLAGVDFEEVF